MTSVIDLSKLPAPQVIEPLDFEQILELAKADLLARNPELAEVLDLESEPVVKLLEDFAYREMLLRARINDAAKSVMLAYAVESDLENLAALFGVERKVIQAADPLANPPFDEIVESDDDLRRRAQLALEGFSTAGPAGAYIFHALSVGDVADAGVHSPIPGQVIVTILSYSNNGQAPQALLDQVALTLNDERIRPLTDEVIIQPATIIDYDVTADLIFFEGPDTGAVLGQAEAALQKYADDHFKLGHDITVSGIHHALHQPGVQRVELAEPSENIVINFSQSARLNFMAVNIGGTDV